MKIDDVLDFCWRVGAMFRGSSDADVVDRRIRRALKASGRPRRRGWRWPEPTGGGGVCIYQEPCEYTPGARKLVRDMQLCPRHRWEMGLADSTEGDPHV